MITIKTTNELLALRDKGGVIRIDDDVQIECDVPYSAGVGIAGIVVSGNLDCMGNLDCKGDYLIIMGDLFWSHAHKPSMPTQTYIKRILPPSYQRDHWQERLGIDISEWCYDTLCGRALKRIPNLLKDEKWSSTERWILETLRDSESTAPGWVAEKQRSEQ